MGYVVTLYDFRPLIRFDGQPWTHADLYEGPAHTGPWTLIDTKPLVPVDSDPEDPISRNFTTAAATQPNDLWYRLTWKDAIENQSDSQAIYNAPGDLIPDPKDVALLLRARLRDDDGNLIPDFGEETSPTLDEMRGIIIRSSTEVQSRVAVKIPFDQIDRVRNVTTLHAAATAERSFFPELTAEQRDTFLSLMTEYNTAMTDPQSGLIQECRHPFSVSLF